MTCPGCQTATPEAARLCFEDETLRAMFIEDATSKRR
jgi:hypothetical protein